MALCSVGLGGLLEGVAAMLGRMAHAQWTFLLSTSLPLHFLMGIGILIGHRPLTV